MTFQQQKEEGRLGVEGVQEQEEETKRRRKIIVKRVKGIC